MPRIKKDKRELEPKVVESKAVSNLCRKCKRPLPGSFLAHKDGTRACSPGCNI